jgi:hypothetical protein
MDCRVEPGNDGEGLVMLRSTWMAGTSPAMTGQVRCPSAAIALTPEHPPFSLPENRPMADHGTVEYATATGNDYAAHEESYESFVHFTLVGILYVVTIMFGLATGGVMGHWLLAATIFVIGLLGAIPGMLSRATTPSYVAFVICFLIFAFTGLSH